MPVTVTGPDGEEQTFVKCAESFGAYVWLEKESLVVEDNEDRSYETAFADTYITDRSSMSPWPSGDDLPREYGWDIDPEQCDDYVQELAEEERKNWITVPGFGSQTVEIPEGGLTVVPLEKGNVANHAALCDEYRAAHGAEPWDPDADDEVETDKEYMWVIGKENVDEGAVWFEYVDEAPDPVDEIREAVCDHVSVKDSVSDGVWLLHTEIDGVDRPSLCHEAIENLQSAGYVIDEVTEYYVRIKKEE